MTIQKFLRSWKVLFAIFITALVGGFIFLAPSAHAAIVYASGTITTATTWTNTNVYVILSSQTIGSGGTLTVNASTVVKFAQGAYLDVAASGTLRASGTSATK